MTRHLRSVLAGISGILLVATGCAHNGPAHSRSDGGGGIPTATTPLPESALKAWGLEYRLRRQCMPRPNRVHVLRVDLAAGRVQPAVVLAPDPDGAGPAEASLTDPRRLAADPSVLAFINTNPWDSFAGADGKKNRNWFEGQAVEILGLAAAGGQIRSLPQPGPASIWLQDTTRVSMGEFPTNQPIAEGMAGFQPILRDGIVTATRGGPIHPRTALGMDRTGSLLWMVVVDGRQPSHSEGMTLRELGRVMRRLGCWNAINMDGGGSSVMGLAVADGGLKIVNSPSDRASGRPRIRPLPAILTLRRTSP